MTAPFTLSVRNQIRQTYGNRCAICLTLLPEVGIQSAHFIDSTASGGVQLAAAVDIGLLTADYQRGSSANALAQCPSCHLSYFTPDLVALSPSLPVLRYIRNYLDTPRANRRSLHEVFALLRLAMAGHAVTLPDPTSILPFLGLFTIVILKPGGLLGCRIPTLHLPALSILQENHFTFAPAGTLPGGENVARIFDVLGMIGLDTVPESCGVIPLSPEYPEFGQQRYWRLTLPPEAILAALIAQIAVGIFEGEEIRLAQEIYLTLRLEALARVPHGGGGPSGGGGPGRGGGSSGGSGRDRGGSGPGARGGGGGGGGKFSAHKRNLRSTNRNPRKKARRTGEGGLGEKGGVRSRPLETAEPGLNDTSSSPEPHQRVSLDDWEVASSFSTTIGNESVQSKSPFADPESMSAGSASEDGCDDPAAWRFGPSYGSDMIIVAARGISLV